MAGRPVSTGRPLARRPCRRGRLSLLGLGAAVRLQAAPGRTTYQLSTPVASRAPETISGVLIESNLRALRRMDAWAVGLLLAMVTSQAVGRRAPPRQPQLYQRQVASVHI